MDDAVDGVGWTENTGVGPLERRLRAARFVMHMLTNQMATPANLALTRTKVAKLKQS